MKSFIEQARFYTLYHQNVKTRYTHMVGVPIILFSLMILLGFVRIIVPSVFDSNLAFFVTIALLIYYFCLNWQLALTLTPLLLILLWIASWFSFYGPTALAFWVFIVTFILGWGLQLYGHRLEGRKPALMDDFSQALIAPMYLTAEAFFMAGYMLPLKEQIYGPAVLVTDKNEVL